MYGGAYYLCGYVVECALKACICKKTREFDFVHSPKIAQLAWTHDFQKLTSVSGLKTSLDDERRIDRDLDENFAIVAGWSEESRYEMREQKEAADLYSAIADQAHGVLRCLEHYW